MALTTELIPSAVDTLFHLLLTLAVHFQGPYRKQDQKLFISIQSSFYL